MNEIITTICGNVATELKQHVTKTGQLSASFRLASTARRFDRALQGFVDQDTTWVNVTCWGGLAQNVAASLQKGQPVVVQGALRVREWKTEDGRSGKDVDLSAHAVGHDLRRGTSSFQKVSRVGAPGAVGTTASGGPDDPSHLGAEVPDGELDAELAEHDDPVRGLVGPEEGPAAGARAEHGGRLAAPV